MSTLKNTNPYNFVPKFGRQLFASGKPVESWLNTSGDVWVYWKDEKNYFLGSNDLLAEKTCICDRKNIVGLNDYDLFPNNLANLFTEADKQVFSSRRVNHFFDYAICKSGDVITFSATKMPLLDKNNVTTQACNGEIFYRSAHISR